MEQVMVQKSHKSTRVASPEATDQRGHSRRKILLSLFWTAALANAATLFGGGNAARAQQKVSKELAQYQDSPKDGHKCSECSFFEPPKACKAVDGDISPDGWCQLWNQST
jgi:hypothetical protein